MQVRALCLQSLPMTGQNNSTGAANGLVEDDTDELEAADLKAAEVATTATANLGSRSGQLQPPDVAIAAAARQNGT